MKGAAGRGVNADDSGQAVFLAYMVVLKKTINVGLSGFLIVFTVIVKLLYATFNDSSNMR